MWKKVPHVKSQHGCWWLIFFGNSKTVRSLMPYFSQQREPRGSNHRKKTRGKTKQGGS